MKPITPGHLWAMLLALASLHHPIHSYAQTDRYSFTKRMNLRIIGGAAAQNGVNYRELATGSTVALYGTGFLGYRYGALEAAASSFGVFVSQTSVTPSSVSRMVSDGALSLSGTSAGGNASALEVEAGFIFGGFLRLSIGAGSLRIPLNAGEAGLSYYTGTAGLVFGAGLLSLHTSTTAMLGGDLASPCYRVNAGLGLSLSFLNGRKRAPALQ